MTRRRSHRFLLDVAITNPAPGLVLASAGYDGAGFTPDWLDGIGPPPETPAPATRRLADWAAGRATAALALAELGAEGPVGRSGDGRPLWPQGVAGSISHDGSRALAAVSRSHRRVGVDIERAESITQAQAAIDIALSPAERDLLPSGNPRYAAAILVFSAKETIFKAFYPEAGRFIGFEAAQFEGLAPQAVMLRLSEDLAPDAKAGRVLAVPCETDGGRVRTWFAE